MEHALEYECWDGMCASGDYLNLPITLVSDGGTVNARIVVLRKQ